MYQNIILNSISRLFSNFDWVEIFEHGLYLNTWKRTKKQAAVDKPKSKISYKWQKFIEIQEFLMQIEGCSLEERIQIFM